MAADIADAVVLNPVDRREFDGTSDVAVREHRAARRELLRFYFDHGIVDRQSARTTTDLAEEWFPAVDKNATGNAWLERRDRVQDKYVHFDNGSRPRASRKGGKPPKAPLYAGLFSTGPSLTKANATAKFWYPMVPLEEEQLLWDQWIVDAKN
jgi:hypothetical protein